MLAIDHSGLVVNAPGPGASSIELAAVTKRFLHPSGTTFTAVAGVDLIVELGRCARSSVPAVAASQPCSP
jgi:hypothetical protein